MKIKQEEIYESGPNLFELEKLFDKQQDEEPDPKALLRWPIHIWVSVGEQFIHPESML